MTPEFMWFIARALVMLLMCPITLLIGEFFSWAVEWIFTNFTKLGAPR